MRSLFPFCLSAVALLTADSVHAQLQVVPGAATNTEGNAAQGTHWRGPRRYQVIYSSAVLTGLNARTVGSLHLRPDGDTASVARDFDVSVTLSSLGVPAPEVADRTSFTANHGRDVTQVAQSVRVSFPAVARGGGARQPFQVAVPFSTPFALPSSQNLLIELEFTPVTGTEPNPWFMDAVTYPTTAWGISITEFGQSCPDQGTFRVFHLPVTPGEQLTFNYASAAPVGAPAVYLLGDSNRQAGGVPLPFDMTPLGAPGCSLYTDIDVVLVARSQVFQNGSQVVAQLPLPRNFALVGTTFYAQALINDPAANQLGIRMSQAQDLHLHTPPSPWLGLMLQASPQGPVTAAQINRVLVVGLQ